MLPDMDTASTRPLDDDAFLAAFLAGTLQAADFDHRGHLRAAWLLLRRHPTPEAVALGCAGIRALATRLGAAGKFHHTRTEALMHCMAAPARAAADWPAFLVAVPELVQDARGVLAHHYSLAVLDAPAARERFVPPDLRPLPA